jgi:hypothetical protein
MNDLLFCKINLKMSPCPNSETRRRLDNAYNVPRIVTLGTCRACGSHEFLLTARVMNVASSRAMLAVAVEREGIFR